MRETDRATNQRMNSMIHRVGRRTEKSCRKVHSFRKDETVIKVVELNQGLSPSITAEAHHDQPAVHRIFQWLN